VIGRVEQSTKDTDDPVGVVHRAVVEAATSAHTSMDSVRRIVLGTPGLVDPSTGDITFAFNLPRWHKGLLAALRDDLHTPIFFENDVNLAAIAEAHAGAAQGVDDFVLIWLGGGMGSAVVLGGKLYHGSTGAAGEIGYLPVPGAQIPRNVSRRAKPAFQQVAGLDAVRAVAREHGFRAATAGDALRAAIAAGTRGGPVLDEVARRLALGVAGTCVVLDPPLVVLAGEMGHAGGTALAERVQHEVAAITLVSPRVVVTQVDREPVLQGALRTALEAVRDEVFGSTVG
jgi:predicted NBD/HSP70 family sugar kinase